MGQIGSNPFRGVTGVPPSGQPGERRREQRPPGRQPQAERGHDELELGSSAASEGDAFAPAAATASAADGPGEGGVPAEPRAPAPPAEAAASRVPSPDGAAPSPDRPSVDVRA
ncbi:MAG TPA: hypothetical protein VD963_10770 [Phycisphaerales bacterium]|nr:hypothetical protein [Phycisphaerales bacterium]